MARSRRRAADDDDTAGSSSSSIFSLVKWEDWRTQLAVSSIPHGIEDLKQIAAGGGVVVLASANPNYIVRWNVSEGSAQLVELRFKTPHKLKRIFVDPTGYHIIVSAVGSTGATTLYAHKDKADTVTLSKLKGYEVSSLAWDPDNAPGDSTGTLLFGTADGQVLEACIEDRKEKRCNVVYHMTDSVSITGLRYDRCADAMGSPKLFVLAATACPTRCYQFYGGPTFTELFASMKNLYYNEIRGEDVEDVQLAVYLAPDRRGGEDGRPSRPKEFGLLTGHGVYHGRMSFKARNSSGGGGDKVVSGERVYPYPAAAVGGAGDDHIPVAIALTEFHFLLLFPSRLLAVSKLSSEVVFEQGFKERFGEMRGMVTDACLPGSTVPFVWLFSNRGVYQLNITDEDRDVWKLYVQIGKKKGDGKFFDTALGYCKSDAQREEVRRAQADFLFAQRNMDGAALSYAETRVPFEEVALKFVNAGEKRALKAFVKLKLGRFSPEDKIQRTVLCTWITEMLLEEIVRLHSIPATATVKLDSDAAEAAVREFREFLREYKDSLDHPTTISLMAGYDRMDDVLYFCELIKDFERIVSYHVQNRDCAAALAVMQSKDVSEDQAADMFYKYTPALIQMDVTQTVKAWRRSRFLDPAKLIPSLVRYSARASTTTSTSSRGGAVGSSGDAGGGGDDDIIVSYLAFIIRRGKHKSAAVYNYLLSLYAERSDDEGLLGLIEEQCGQAQPTLDLNFALRVCSSNGKHSACVLLYKALKLHDEALDAALKVDLTAAQEVANTPDLDEALRKTLWMKLLRNAIQQQKVDIGVALELLKHCDVLKIDDVLPLFPDFTVIEDFKEEISASLEDSSHRLQELREDMKDFTDSAERIRQDIKSLRYRCGVVKAAQKCEICTDALLQSDFYLFPCTHGFHSKCLIDEVVSHLGSAQASRVKQLQKDLRVAVSKAAVSAAAPTQVSGIASGAGSNDDQAAATLVQSELDDAVASECPLCGEAMIDSVAVPFLDDGDAGLSEWDI